MNPQNRYTRPPAKIEPAYSIVHQPANLPANQPYAFVCLNLVPAQQFFARTGAVPEQPYKLFVVDSPLASLFDAKYDWRSYGCTSPHRRFRDPEKSKQAKSRPDGYSGSCLSYEDGITTVWRHAHGPGANLALLHCTNRNYHDLRLFNLNDGRIVLKESDDFLLSQLPGYEDACRHWEFCARQPVRPFSRASSQQLSDADVLDLLLVAQAEPGISLQELSRIAHEQHGVRIHLRVLKEILSGFRRRQPGVDYVKLCEERNKAIDALEE